MVLREKSPSSRGWRTASSKPGLTDNIASFAPRPRNAVFFGFLLLFLWIVLGNDPSDDLPYSAASVASTIREKAGLGSSLDDMDPELFGPPVKNLEQRPLHPATSKLDTAVSWKDGVPETTVHGLNGGRILHCP